MKEFIHTVLYQPFFNLLIFIAWIVPGHSIAVSIILLTVLVRLILLPSSIKAAHHQVRSLEMQPKINKIRSEIKDQQEQSKALMALYKEEGFSPFGSCLPLLIQIPIIWVLFSVFKSGVDIKAYADLYSFLPRPETVNTFFLGFDITKPDPWVLPIIAGLLQFGLSYLSMLPQKNIVKSGENDPTAMMTKQMLFIAPLITVFFGRTMPVALVIYWITTTIFGIFQQLYVNKQIMAFRAAQPKQETDKIEAEKAPTKEIEAPKKKNDFITNMMSKRLDKQEKKLGVNVTVRTKKK
jgi:YidC/Oxa1 family membrane protein insertase